MSRVEYHVVMVLQKWVDQETALGHSMAPTMGDGSIAFLPVFDTAERAEAEYPGRSRMVIAATEGAA